MARTGFIVISLVIAGMTLAIKPQPPAISYVSNAEYFSKELNLTCLATGYPEPRLSWKKDGTDLSNGGNFNMPNAKEIDSGVYQCFAQNEHGIAVTEEIRVKKAELGAFLERKLTTVDAQEGDHVVLKCSNPPLSFPSGQCNWYTSPNTAVASSLRVVVDQNCDLHFINVATGDELGAKQTYNCSIHNSHTSSRVYGSPVNLTVNKATGSLNKRSLSIRWRTEEKNINALVKGSFELQCIPDGNPIPSVTWMTPNGEPKSQKYAIDKKKYTLKVTDVTFADEGTYKCTATNGATSVEGSIFVDVKAHPKCAIEPSALTLPEDADGSFTCNELDKDEADKSTITWFKDDVELTGSQKFKVSGNILTIHDVKKPEDMMSLQCKVKNSVGSHLSGATLTVIKKLTFKQILGPQEAIDSGAIAKLYVEADVDPDYTADLSFVWKKGGQELTGNDVYTITSKGMSSQLLINTSAVESEVAASIWGEYVCLASVEVPAADKVATMQLLMKPGSESASSAGPTFALWWIGVLVAIVFAVICVFLIVCLLYRGRGATYLVDKRERLAGHDPEKELADQSLHELDRAERPTEPMKNLEWQFNERSIEGDVGGLNDDGEPSLKRFGEDGSFVGQYGK